MARILITHGYRLTDDPAEQALGKPYPPLGTLLSAGLLQRNGHNVTVHDATFDPDISRFKERLENEEPDLVFVLTDNLAVPPQMCTESLRRATLEVVEHAASEGWPVLVSAPDATNHPEIYVEGGGTWVIKGDVDSVIVDIADGKIAAGTVATETVLDDLDALPAPPWQLIDLEPYRQMWLERHGHWELNLSTSRGCPYRCNWCAKPVWGRTYHVRSAEHAVADLKQTLDHVKPDRIWFTDDIFAMKPSWLKAFADGVEASGTKVPFRCLSRVDLLREGKYTEDLARAGCREVWVGAESGSQHVLDAMDKDCTVEDIARATKLLHQHRIDVGFFLQLGYPGEDLNDVFATLAMVRRLRPDEIGVSVSYPLPGTSFHERVHDQMRQDAWDASMECDLLFESPFSQRFYKLVKQTLASEHRLANLPRSAVAFAKRPGRFTGRRLASSFVHAARLPLLHREIRREATYPSMQAP